MESGSMDDEERQFLNNIGGEPLDGSGFEAESDDRDRKIAVLRELQKIGSITCFIPPDKLPTNLA